MGGIVTDATNVPKPAWKPPAGATDAEKVQDQVQRQAGLTGGEAGGGTLFTEPVLVVNQKMKIIELVNEYMVYDKNGTQIGAVAEVNQSPLKHAARFLTSLDQFLTHTYEIRDENQQPILVLHRPRKILKSKFKITKPDGTEVGDIAQKGALGKIKFAIRAGGKEIGIIQAENWRAWNFHVKDATGTEVARITKTFEGILKTSFTTADNYVVEFHGPMEQPLHSLVVVAALCIDTALKQDDRGLN